MKTFIRATIVVFFFGASFVNAQSNSSSSAVKLLSCKATKLHYFESEKFNLAELDKWKREIFRAESQTSYIAKCRAKDGLF